MSINHNKPQTVTQKVRTDEFPTFIKTEIGILNRKFAATVYGFKSFPPRNRNWRYFDPFENDVRTAIVTVVYFALRIQPEWIWKSVSKIWR